MINIQKILSKISFFSVLFTSWFFVYEMTCVRDGLYKTSLDTARVASPTRHLAFIFVRPLVLCWCLFVLHLCMLVLLFVCLICIKTPLVDFMYIYIAKKTVDFAFMVIDDIILLCWIKITIDFVKMYFLPYPLPILFNH